MLEGSTGCFQWEAGFLLGAFILSNPHLFSGMSFSPNNTKADEYFAKEMQVILDSSALAYLLSVQERTNILMLHKTSPD